MTKHADAEVSFEESLGRLEEIVRQLEDGSLGLSDSLARYEEGMKCLKRCHEALERAERKIELLTRVDAEGNETTQTFDEEQMTLDEKAAARSRRRSKGDASSTPRAPRVRDEKKEDDEETDDDSRSGRLF